MCTFYELKSPKMQAKTTGKYFGKTVFKTGLRFSSPFKIFMPDTWALKSLVLNAEYYYFARKNAIETVS
jgi:hypothetical protein